MLLPSNVSRSGSERKLFCVIFVLLSVLRNVSFLDDRCPPHDKAGPLEGTPCYRLDVTMVRCYTSRVENSSYWLRVHGNTCLFCEIRRALNLREIVTFLLRETPSRSYLHTPVGASMRTRVKVDRTPSSLNFSRAWSSCCDKLSCACSLHNTWRARLFAIISSRSID